jgi:hypothetical protein
LLKILGVASDEAIKKAMKSHPQARDFEKNQIAETVEAASESSPADQIAAEQGSRTARPPRDRAVLKSTTSKVLGGIVVGAAVAGISSLFKRGKGR